MAALGDRAGSGSVPRRNLAKECMSAAERQWLRTVRSRCRAGAAKSAGLDELRSGLLLAFGIDHLGTPQPLGLGLLGDRADRVFIEIDMFDLDIGHLDALGVGLLIEDFRNVSVEPIPLRQQCRHRNPFEGSPKKSAAKSVI